MQKKHLAQVAKLDQEAHPAGWNKQMFEDELARDSRNYLVVLQGRQVVGHGGTMMVGEDCHITNLVIRDENRRQGLGLKLLDELIAQAIEYGAQRSTLEVRESNTAALRLYERAGFQQKGKRKDYYCKSTSSEREDALILWKT